MPLRQIPSSCHIYVIASIHIHIEPELVGLDVRQHGVPSRGCHGRRNAMTGNSGIHIHGASRLLFSQNSHCCPDSNDHRNRPKRSAPVPLSRRVANCSFRGRSHAHTLRWTWARATLRLVLFPHHQERAFRLRWERGVVSRYSPLLGIGYKLTETGSTRCPR